MSIKALIVAGTHSGCGKTSLALGLMSALRAKGLKVAPFKLGPDFIDPGHHLAACGVTSHNLDGFMLSREANLEIFARYAKDADIAIIEGMMGLYDGAGGLSEQGSTAEMAKWLGAPVLLALDASSMGRSAVALASGFADFDPGLKLAGLVFNRVASLNHETILREAMSSRPDLPLLGMLARREDIAAPSRHLGLVMAAEEEQSAERMRRLGDWAREGLDLDLLLASAGEIELYELPEDVYPAPDLRLGVARDAAFCFYYPENLRLLRAAGVEIVEFSPLEDAYLPPDLQGLYFGGGYPELYAAALAANRTLLKDVRGFAASGRPIYAECGGLMYLLTQIEDLQGATHRMCGIIPGRAAMNRRLAALGYREIATTSDTLLGAAGTMARGHEFHYSSLTDEPDWLNSYACLNRKAQPVLCQGFARGKILGSYLHLHFASNKDIAANLAAACRVNGRVEEKSEPGEAKPKLREGFTTGTAAAGAAKAAAHFLLGLPLGENIEVPLPQGGRYRVPLKAVAASGARAARAEVIKDAGDDPDVTDKAVVSVLVELARGQTREVRVEGGRGVGRVTLPGLPAAVGQAAINPAPKAQIIQAVSEALEAAQFAGGARVLVEVPKGEELAKKTMNPRLGIVGGISILGSSGLVKPFSHEAWKATIEESLDVARATGLDTAGFATGRRALKLLAARHPEIPQTALVLAADFFEFSLLAARSRGFRRLYWGAFFGKLVKMALGFKNTHAHQAELDFSQLADWAAAAGIEAGRCVGIKGANTAAEALEIARPDPACQVFLDRLTARARGEAVRLGQGIAVTLHLFDFSGQELARAGEEPEQGK